MQMLNVNTNQHFHGTNSIYNSLLPPQYMAAAIAIGVAPLLVRSRISFSRLALHQMGAAVK
jgi:hypothetical protein